jgi:hypothetical protein
MRARGVANVIAIAGGLEAASDLVEHELRPRLRELAASAR